MAAIRLERRPQQRIWGRRELPAGFEDCRAGEEPVGEIWYENGAAAALLVKYLFTSERLSIQVHPHGKDEAWLVLDAEPGAAIGLGLRRPVSPAELRAAALDGSLEALVDWRPVKAGDSFFSPAGTIHAIGGGLTLIEIQQNLDLTYRLYDYGRPRELQLDQALAVAKAAPFAPPPPRAIAPGREALASGGAFVVERWRLSGRHRLRAGEELVLVPLGGGGALDGQPLAAGAVWQVSGEASLDAAGGADLLAAYPGGAVAAGIIRPEPRRSRPAYRPHSPALPSRGTGRSRPSPAPAAAPTARGGR